MKTRSLATIAAISAALVSPLFGQAGTAFTNFVRQVQLPTGVERDLSVAATGAAQSPLAINPGGARFELWTVKNTNPPTSYLLDSKYVGTYVPIGQIRVYSEDPYTTIPRTRADRPFYVERTVSGLLTGDPDAPEASLSVNFLRHVQSYGAGGTGVNLNRSLATLLGEVSVIQNGVQTITYAVNAVPGANRAKVRGEERFSIFSLEDYQAPESQLSSQFIQIWPVADGAIAGITNNQSIRFALPNVTLTANDVYPNSHTYAQVYKGAPALGKTGYIVPGSSKLINDTIPHNLTLPLSGYDSVFDEGGDGQWTMELVTETPFGVDRLAYVSFSLDRTIQMNGSVTTQD